MDQVKETLSGFLLGLGAYAVLIEIVGFFFSEDFLSYTLGLLCGTVSAVILILHMAKTIGSALELSPEQAGKYVKRQSFLRLLLMLLVMIAGLAVDRINFITVVLGLLGLKIGALIAPFFLKRLYPTGYVTPSFEEVDAEGP